VWISDFGYDSTLHAFDKRAAKLGVDQTVTDPNHPDRQGRACVVGVVGAMWISSAASSQSPRLAACAA